MITLDGSDPTKISSKYTGPIKLKKPYPRLIKVLGIERCKFCSEIASFEVPDETDPPVGYFDPITKAFHIISNRQDTLFFLTLDGSKPTVK